MTQITIDANSDALKPVEQLLASVTGEQKKRMMIAGAKALQKAQITRIRTQTDVQGKPFKPRRPLTPEQIIRFKKPPNINQQKLFITLIPRIKYAADNDSMSAYVDRQIEKIARIHNQGLQKLPKREFFGINDTDLQNVLDAMTESINI